jgi:hypothetical protein
MELKTIELCCYIFIKVIKYGKQLMFAPLSFSKWFHNTIFLSAIKPGRQRRKIFK